MERSLESSGRPWLAALALIAAVTVLRVAYVLWLCPYALIEDEAYYWLWSRHMDWAYATKGPGIAATIAAGARLLGDTEPGVRLTAPIWGGLLALGVAGIAGQIAPAESRRRARLWGAGLALLAAPLQAMSILMLIDGPALACWALATWSALRAMHARSGVAWLGLGGAIGAGLLFKPVLLLLALGLIAHAIVSRRRLQLATRWRAWMVGGIALAAAGLAPIAVWNASHDWITATHLLGHVRAPSEPIAAARRLTWLGEYVGLQLLLGGVGLLIGVLGAKAMVRPRESSPTSSGISLCVWSSLPVYAAYLAVSVFTRVEGNWALGGLIGWLGIAGAWAATPATPSTLALHLRRAAVVVGLITGLGMARLDLAARLPLVGPLVPIGRLTVGPALADAAERAIDHGAVIAGAPRHRSPEAAVGGTTAAALPTDPAPLILTDHYGSASQIAFYLRARAIPVHVTCATGVLGRPRTQFDLWPDARADDERLTGRSAVLIGSRRDVWESIFERVEPIGLAGDDRSGVLADSDPAPIPGDHKRRRAFIGIGYRGATEVRPGGTEAAGG